MDYLFVYGTLMKTMKNNMAKFLYMHSHFQGNAYIHGKLYDLVAYPGAVASENTFERVHGHVFKIREALAVFNVLDAYEGIGVGNPADYEYVRTRVKAYLEDGTQVNTWFYAYNFPTYNFQLISSGRYL